MINLNKIINRIVFKNADDKARAKEVTIIKAFSLPPWAVKIPPKLFALYTKAKGYKVQHSMNAIEFFIRGERVAYLEMIGGIKPGKFTKYEREKSKKNKADL